MKGQIRASFSTETARQVGRFHFGWRVPLGVGFQRRTIAVCGGYWWLWVMEKELGTLEMVWIYLDLKLVFGLNTIYTWFRTCRIQFEQNWMWARWISKSALLCRKIVVELCSRIFQHVQKMLVHCWLWERVVQNEFWMFASRSQRSQCRLMHYRLPVKFWSRSNG